MVPLDDGLGSAMLQQALRERPFAMVRVGCPKLDLAACMVEGGGLRV